MFKDHLSDSAREVLCYTTHKSPAKLQNKVQGSAEAKAKSTRANITCKLQLHLRVRTSRSPHVITIKLRLSNWRNYLFESSYTRQRLLLTTWVEQTFVVVFAGDFVEENSSLSSQGADDQSRGSNDGGAHDLEAEPSAPAAACCTPTDGCLMRYFKTTFATDCLYENFRTCCGGKRPWDSTCCLHKESEWQKDLV